ncbi:MAG: protein kinase [Gemmatimonadetes bacterium]|nr:protein kinase [Gemmatimonadota bacterium]
MYCSRCGTQFPDQSKFCPSCGLEVGGAATTPVKAIAAGEMTEMDMVRDALASEYEISEELGRGGMAIVYRAKDKQLEREVAVKVLPFSLAFDAEFVERFQREARTAAQLEHPSIIPIYRVGKSGRVIFFVMKFLRGKSLSNVLRDRGRMSPPEIRRLLLEAGGALGHAAKHGIVHRDIKPDNIMFDEFGQCIVTDFGIAKAASGQKLTGTGMSIGTPHYMSPEQARAQPIDGRSDIYSLGIVAYQALVGQVPYDGDDSFSIGYKHIMEPIPEPSLQSADERQLFEVIKRMIAKDPNERFQSSDELVAALEGGPVAGGATSSARVATATRNAAQATTPLPKYADPLPKGAPPTERKPLGTRAAAKEEKSSPVGLILLVLVLLGGGGGGYYWFVMRPKQIAATPGATPADPTHGANPVAGLDTTLASLANAGANPAAHPAGRDSTGAAAATPSPSGAPGDSGSLRIGQIPRGAEVMVDGKQMHQNPSKLSAGEHDVLITAQGYDNFRQRVRVTKDQVFTLAPDLRRFGQTGNTETASREITPVAGGRTSGANCSEPGATYNINNSCWDKRPRPSDATPPAVPVSDQNMQGARPTILNIHVSAQGGTVDVRSVRPSNDQGFEDLAKRYARAMQWTPASKNGTAVDSWVQQQLVPTAP